MLEQNYCSDEKNYLLYQNHKGLKPRLLRRNIFGELLTHPLLPLLGGGGARGWLISCPVASVLYREGKEEGRRKKL
ncbi:MAG: hypothetical protein F6K48_07540 [Okeania sp. SIO3H1]|nr:hypothetical protein [Okeania sp. SIO3H1]